MTETYDMWFASKDAAGSQFKATVSVNNPAQGETIALAQALWDALTAAGFEAKTQRP